MLTEGHGEVLRGNEHHKSLDQKANHTDHTLPYFLSRSCDHSPQLSALIDFHNVFPGITTLNCQGWAEERKTKTGSMTRGLLSTKH